MMEMVLRSTYSCIKPSPTGQPSKMSKRSTGYEAFVLTADQPDYIKPSSNCWLLCGPICLFYVVIQDFVQKALSSEIQVIRYGWGNFVNKGVDTSVLF